jgi:4-alpha-glucanotransferase
VSAYSHHSSLGSWGVLDGFWDISGHWNEAPTATVEAILDAMGATDAHPPPPALVTVRLDHPLPEVPPGRIVLEDGGHVRTGGILPPDLPPGYHLLEPADGPSFPLVASPGKVSAPEGKRWGFSVQLYASRSAASWGIGDLADLRRIASWSASLGAGAVMVNPLHAASPTYPQEASPYFPGSRCFMNPLYIAVEEVPLAAGRAEVADAAVAGRELNSRRLIDRDRVWSLKSAALEAIFADFHAATEFELFRASRGESLDRFATFCSLAELHGPSWQSWPSQYRTPDSAEVREFVTSREGAERVRYHSWLQWLLDRQLARASARLGVVQDLAVGVNPGGADSWIWQDTFAPGMRVGAPPDEFNTQGQDWCLPAFDPWRLRSAGYEPWIESLRAAFRHGEGLRVDHVMGLFRLYWIPEGASPHEGAYVRYPHDDMLNILALEAHRAGAFVMGEDLGTVEDSVRNDLRARRVLSYRLWWFDDTPTASWPYDALGAVTTHDLATVAGVMTGTDLENQRSLGLNPNEQASAELRRKLLDRTGCDDTTPLARVVECVHDNLAEAPCALLAATLDDAAMVQERPNMPGTLDEWPNWCIALPVPLEEIEESDLPRAIARSLSRREAR